MKSNLYRILVLEDDEILSQTIKQFLVLENYEVELAFDGEDAIDLTFKNSFDLYLFDINVPLINGVDILKLLRESGDKTPAFFITALRDIESLTSAFDSGCDDYIKKPFDIEELLVRIRSILKRGNPTLVYKNIKFDLFENRIFKDEIECNFGNVEKEAFALLIKNISKTIEKPSFFDVMNKPSDAALRVLINKLRKTLNVNITNIKGIGYKLERS